MSGIFGTSVTGAGGPTAYTIDNSLRFRQSASAYLTRTPASASGQNQWTFSTWIKRSTGSFTTQQIIGGNTTTSGGTRNMMIVEFSGDNLWVYAFNNSSGYYFQRTSTPIYRDPSSWYHLVVQFDPDNGTSANKVIAYINGQQVTWGTSSDSGAAGSITSTGYRAINNTFRNDINGGYQGGGAPIYFGDGYLAECIMVSGSIVAYTEFGTTNASTGIWQPKAYTGSYGTNGFYLKFSSIATTSGSNTGLGQDFSGNGNYWNTVNISVTAGSTYDAMTDSPTPKSSTVGNFPVWNPINRLPVSATYIATFSNGNLQLSPSAGEGSGNGSAVGTMQIPSTGKWYWEVTITNRATLAASRSQIGIVKGSAIYTDSGDVAYNTTSNACYVYSGDGSKAVSYGIFSGYGSAWTNGDVIGVACDWDAGTLTFYKNGVSQGTAFSGLSGSDNYFPIAGYFGTFNINFGQRPFAYSIPSGHNRLQTSNLPTPTIGASSTTLANKYFDVSLWTGNGTSQSITNSGSMKPDFIWIKRRNTVGEHALINAVRGGNKTLASNTANSEANQSWTLTFNSNGFTVPTGDSLVNGSGITYVGWQWRASNATAVTNTAGSITSTVSANTTAGFSIVTWTGTGSSGTTGHGLGAAPKMIILKDASNGYNWYVFTTATGSNLRFEGLNTTAAATSQPSQYTTTSTLIQNIPGIASLNTSGATMIAYCFAEVTGYSKFASYTGNGSSDGPFIYTGFRPEFVLVKASSTGENWAITDAARSPFNAANAFLRPDEASAETTGAMVMDFTANGFKMRNSDTKSNGSGITYIYMAFAENPFNYSLAR